MIKILFACTLAVLLVGCKTTAIAADTRSTDLTFDKALNIQLVDPVTGELVTLKPCGRECRVLQKENVLVDSRTFSLSVNQFSNPHCCYTYNFDGLLYEYCWDLPRGTQCPILR
jgi:hypothetical protein